MSVKERVPLFERNPEEHPEKSVLESANADISSARVIFTM
jgi:hypothetical protein